MNLHIEIPGFPVLVCAMILFRVYIAPKWFSPQELKVMDERTANNKVVLASLGGAPTTLVDTAGLERRYSEQKTGVPRQRAGSMHRWKAWYDAMGWCLHIYIYPLNLTLHFLLDHLYGYQRHWSCVYLVAIQVSHRLTVYHPSLTSSSKIRLHMQHRRPGHSLNTSNLKHWTAQMWIWQCDWLLWSLFYAAKLVCWSMQYMQVSKR